MPFNFDAFVTFLLREGSFCSRFQTCKPGHRVLQFCPCWLGQRLWRNWLARSAVNRKVGGSRTPRSECLFKFYALHSILLRECFSCSRFQACIPVPGHRVIQFCPYWLDQLFWRNWLARLAVNRKVGGSSPSRSECLLIVTPLSRSSYVKVLPVLGSRPVNLATV